MDIVYEDNHIIVVNKMAGEIVQGDKTGDKPLSEFVKDYIKEKYSKPGNVFCGVVHRIDRPVSGLVVFARTSKALSRLNEMLRKGDIHKSYLALVEGKPKHPSGLLEDYIVSDGRLNKSRIVTKDTPDAKHCQLEYDTVAEGERYTLLRINLLTGRKHQIRLQLASRGNPIKGDLKYGARRSNPNGGISLQAAHIDFIHPVKKDPVSIDIPPLPDFQPILESQKKSN
ncbi:MAG: RNA pseudouridine synthase [Muribaculum sp.]|nr:RNA pseudouridine synthase [Muribaculum sp.]